MVMITSRQGRCCSGNIVLVIEIYLTFTVRIELLIFHRLAVSEIVVLKSAMWWATNLLLRLVNLAGTFFTLTLVKSRSSWHL